MANDGTFKFYNYVGESEEKTVGLGGYTGDSYKKIIYQNKIKA